MHTCMILPKKGFRKLDEYMRRHSTPVATSLRGVVGARSYLIDFQGPNTTLEAPALVIVKEALIKPDKLKNLVGDRRRPFRRFQCAARRLAKRRTWRQAVLKISRIMTVCSVAACLYNLVVTYFICHLGAV